MAAPSPPPSPLGQAERLGGRPDFLPTPSKSPHSLRDALRAAGGGPDDYSESTSEEDYDNLTQSPDTLVLRRKLGKKPDDDRRPRIETQGANGLPKKLSEDKELREALRRGIQRAKATPTERKNRAKFRDLVFTRQFSAFDRQNESAANSPFHGFFMLFWMGVFLFVLKIGAENWRNTGNVLGTNEIMIGMSAELIIMLTLDGVMCGLTGVSWLIQLLVYHDYLDWDRSGWVVQNLWQTAFIGGSVALIFHRPWPWTHAVFFVLHSLTMLMKQHSYAFYNGYLSTIYKRQANLLIKLKQLDLVSPVQSPTQTQVPDSAPGLKQRRHSIDLPSDHNNDDSGDNDITKQNPITKAMIQNLSSTSNELLSPDQIHLCKRILKWDITSLSDELRGKASTNSRTYPNNLTMFNHYEYIVFPTVVYELEYPRGERINWGYVGEKGAAVLGVIFVMIMVSQALIYPIIVKAVQMKEDGIPLDQRLRTFPWMLIDLMIPLMMEYLLAWYLIWESVLNILAELTFFADRNFYDTWWNSVSWDQYARDWNRPVHNFLLRHVYHSSISFMKVNKHTATLITFLISACIHELVMACIFKKLRGYLLILQMCQLPLVALSRTRWLRGQETLGNLIFWLGLFLGPSALCSLYVVL